VKHKKKQIIASANNFRSYALRINEKKPLQAIKKQSHISFSFPFGETTHTGRSPIGIRSISSSVNEPFLIRSICQCFNRSTLEAGSEPLKSEILGRVNAFRGYPAQTVLIPLKNHRVSWLTSMRQNLNEKCIHNQMHEFN
jgi:hypothetical protein